MQRLVSVMLVGGMLMGAMAVAVIAVPLSRYGEDEGAGNVGTESVSVILRPTDLVVSASVDLAWSAPLVVRSGSAGLVSAAFVSSGGEVRCGVPVFEVDAQPVVAFCGPRPLTSAVTATSKGRDADDFVAWLRSAGFFEGVASPSGGQRGDAIRFWQSSLGMAADGVVDPGDLLWVVEPLIPTRVDVAVGLPVAVGDAVFAVEERLVAASIGVSGSDWPEGDLVFGVDTNPARVEIMSDGSVKGVAALEAILRDSGLLADGLPVSASGSVRLAKPMELAMVPASSILTAPTGTCVLIAFSGEQRAVSVNVVAATVGSVFVDGDLQAGTQVVVDPDRSTPC